MGASGRVQAFIRNQQAFYRTSSDDVAIDDLADVGGGDASVPDGFRINDYGWPVLALIEASGLVGTDGPLNSPLGKFLLKEFLEARLSFRIAAAARVLGRALVAADEDMLFELGHAVTVLNSTAA